MSAFLEGDLVEVTDDTPEVEERYFGGTGARWRITSLWNTNCEGLMANLSRMGYSTLRRSVQTSRLRRAELPEALR